VLVTTNCNLNKGSMECLRMSFRQMVCNLKRSEPDKRVAIAIDRNVSCVEVEFHIHNSNVEAVSDWPFSGS
jgi:hypothetical protein